MRVVFLLLLLANIGLGVYLALGPERHAEGYQPGAPLNAEKIRILPPDAVAARNPGPAACLEWGNFAGEEVARAEAALATLGLGDRLGRRHLEETTGWWVYIPPMGTKAEADRKTAELKGLGIGEFFVMREEGRWNHAISLGLFKSEDAANRFLAQMQQKGVKSAVVGARTSTLKRAIFILRDPGEAVTARMVELQRDFAGSDLKAAPCEPAPAATAASSPG